MAEHRTTRPRARPEADIPIPRPRPRPAGLGNAAAQDRAGTARAPTPAPAIPYTDMNRSQKANHLAALHGQSAGLLEANGVSEHMQTKMGAIMANEGGRNLRRAHQTEAFMGHAIQLNRALGDRDPAELRQDPEAWAAFRKDLSEEQAHLLDDSMAGKFDLAGVSSDDDAVRKATAQQVTDSGVQLRASQYQEMNDLRAKRDGDEELTRDERARLSKLEGFSYRQTGFGGKMGQVGGMSKERFAEIYDEGQQRFEPNQYRKLVRSYEKNKGRRDAGDDPNAGFQMSASIGTFDVDADMERQLDADYDLIADMASSYGTSQIMGAYAQQGLLSAKGADGVEDAVSLPELKASGERLTPTPEDVHQQIAFMNMKGVNLGSTGLSNDRLTRTYNGSQPGSDLYDHYMDGLAVGTRDYSRARDQLS